VSTTLLLVPITETTLEPRMYMLLLAGLNSIPLGLFPTTIVSITLLFVSITETVLEWKLAR